MFPPCVDEPGSLLKKNPSVGLSVSVLGRPGVRNDQPMGYRTSAQQVFHRETRQLVASALVRPAADGKTGAMVITLPLGLNLTEPVLVKVDNGTAERQSIQTCTNVGCFVAMTLTDKFIRSEERRVGNEWM